MEVLRLKFITCWISCRSGAAPSGGAIWQALLDVLIVKLLPLILHTQICNMFTKDHRSREVGKELGFLLAFIVAQKWKLYMNLAELSHSAAIRWLSRLPPSSLILMRRSLGFLTIHGSAMPIHFWGIWFESSASHQCYRSTFNMLRNGLLWPSGHRTMCEKYGQMGNPWKELKKCT